MLGWTLSIAFVLAASPAPSQSSRLRTLAPEKPISLLGDHLRIRMPSAALVEPYQRDVMSATASGQAQTRVIVDAGEERLMLMAEETFATAPVDLVAALRRTYGAAGASMNLEPLKIGDLRAVAVTPSTLDFGHAGIFIYGLYVACADGSLSELEFYVTPDAARNDLDAVRKAVQKLAQTITAGARALELKGGKAKLSDGLSITLPAQWVVTEDQGTDFVVHRFHRLAPFGEKTPTLGIYLGQHASSMRGELGRDVAVTRSEGTLLGQKAQWYSWKNGGELSREAIVPVPNKQHLVAHVFFSAPTEAGLEEVARMVGTLSPQP